MTPSSVTVALQEDLLRQKTAEAVKRHRASWVELGQYLFTIYKDKHYRGWGHLSFEAYCVKELGLKLSTASKLLKSYSFLEKEEPRIVNPRFVQEGSPKAIPNYESVNLLRLAKENKKLTPSDYADLREAVLEDAKEPKEVRAQFKKILSEHEPKDSHQVRQERRNTSLKRVITILSGARREFSGENFLPPYLLKQMDDLIEKLQHQLE